MRELKFRKWNDIEKSFTWMKVNKRGGWDITGDVYVDGNTNPWEQFTGLQDSEGNDIYENDIIEFTYWWFDGAERDTQLKGLIVYAKELLSFQLKGVKNKEWEQFTGCEENNEYLTAFSELRFTEDDFSIIGNINENPELLK